MRLAADAKADHVSTLLPVGEADPSGAMLIGGCGAGLDGEADPSGVPPSTHVTLLNTPLPKYPPLPALAKPPTLAELNSLLARLGAVAPESDSGKPFAVSLDDDWQTEGDWLRRYGRYWACVPAFFHPIPIDDLWGAGWEPVSYDMKVGPDHLRGDGLRYWLQARYTTEPHCLEMPPTYLSSRVSKGYTNWTVERRDTSVDDHGEETPMSMEGPGIDATVAVPDGLFVLSLYFFSRQDSATSRRDFRLSVRPHVGIGLDDASQFEAQPELADGRVRQDFGGVWKRFLVRGPEVLTVRVERRNSWNTELDGVMLDLADERPAPYFETVPQWQARQAGQDQRRKGLLAETSAAHAARFAPAKTEREAAAKLFAALEDVKLTNPAWWGENSRPFYRSLLRSYKRPYDGAYPHPDKLLASRFGACAYQTGLLPEWEKCQNQQGVKTARQVEKSLWWDGVTPSCSGLGYQIVSAKVKGGKAGQAARTASANAAEQGGDAQTN